MIIGAPRAPRGPAYDPILYLQSPVSCSVVGSDRSLGRWMAALGGEWSTSGPAADRGDAGAAGLRFFQRQAAKRGAVVRWLRPVGAGHAAAPPPCIRSESLARTPDRERNVHLARFAAAEGVLRLALATCVRLRPTCQIPGRPQGRVRRTDPFGAALWSPRGFRRAISASPHPAPGVTGKVPQRTRRLR